MTPVGATKTESEGALDELFDRVNKLLGDPSQTNNCHETSKSEGFVPRQPRNMRETGLNPTMLEKIIIRFLCQVGAETSRRIASQLRLPSKVLEQLFKQLRFDKYIDLAGTTPDAIAPGATTWNAPISVPRPFHWKIILHL